jgi:two-component system, cell cycle sensor histidine kinase and response regulator CckA
MLFDFIQKEYITGKKKWLFEIVLTIVFITLVSILLVTLSRQYSSTIVDSRKTQLQIICTTVSKNLDLGITRNIENLLFFSKSLDYKNVIDTFDGKNTKLVMHLFDTFRTYHQQGISDMVLSSAETGKIIVSLNGQKYTLFRTLGFGRDYKMALWIGKKNEMFFGVHLNANNGYVLSSYVNMDHLYDQYVSFIKLGNKGYIMLKDCDGIIIMHPLKEQIGINASTDRQQLYPGVKLELESLAKMIDHQKEGKEGVEIYKSYWWPDKKHIKLITKISAYTPLPIGDTFFIISAVTDYKEISDQITRNLILITVISLLIFSSLILLVMSLVYAFRHGKAIEKENVYLRKLNETLQTLHENEQIISHQQRLQIIGMMTGGIAHEFNNLLTPIMGYSGLMLETMNRQDENYEGVSEIFDAANKAKEIIQQISLLSKRNFETVYKFCNVSQLLERAVKMAAAIKPPATEISLMVSDVDRGLFGNVTQLNQVLLNIFMNAFQAIGNKPGFLRVAYREITRREIDITIPVELRSNLDEKNSDFGEISVTDNGCGIDKQTAARIFDPFFTTKAAAGGTGLGLFVVQNIIASHRGAIVCDSTPRKRTEFRIILPLAEKASESQQKKSMQPPSQAGFPVSILLVDDNLRVLRLLEKGLNMNNNKVCAVDSPLEAFNLLKERNFDILVTDNSMKNITGIGLSIKARQFHPAMPIIIVTGLLDREIIEAKQSRIIDSYLVKPITIQILTAEIRRLMSGQVTK